MTETRCPTCEEPYEVECEACQARVALPAARRRRKTSCKNGHAFDVANTLVRMRSTGLAYQVCMTCRVARNAARARS